MRTVALPCEPNKTCLADGGLTRCLEQPDCTCTDCGDCIRRRNRQRNKLRRASVGNLASLAQTALPDISGLSLATAIHGGVSPSAAYLRKAAVPSKPFKANMPLVVLSLDSVLECRLPHHLTGGYTDTLARGFLRTFMDYILLPGTPWCVVFFTALPRKLALKTLEDLNLPTGGPERDERDGVLGVFCKEDMRHGWTDDMSVKDLDVLWKVLLKASGDSDQVEPQKKLVADACAAEQEQNMQFGVENTVVITE